MKHIDLLMERYPSLEVCRADIVDAAQTIIDMHKKGGALLICGNGGSSADAEHISGELLKGFLKKRPLSDSESASLPDAIAQGLQGGIRAIPLTSLTALGTAFSNDVDAELVYAQLVWALGDGNSVFLGISTSGNAKNVSSAALVAKAKGLKTIGLTGVGGGKLAEICDTCIKAPECETYKIQELHLPIYHAICAQVEEEFFTE